jgi:hypothetical protein
LKEKSLRSAEKRTFVMLGVLGGVGFLGPWSGYNRHMNYSNQTMEANQRDFIMAGRICRAGRALCELSVVEAFYVMRQ